MSGFLVALGGLALIGYDAYLFISHSSQLYDNFFGVYGLRSFQWRAEPIFSAWGQVFLASKAAYYVFLVGAALVVGLCLFTVLQTLGIFISGSSSLARALLNTKARNRASSKELLSRFLVRLLSLIGWCVFTVIFVNWILPFCIVLSQSGIQQIRAGNLVGLLGCTGSYALLVLALHLHVIFIRLVVLRPRLFGGEAEIIEAESAAHSTSP